MTMDNKKRKNYSIINNIVYLMKRAWRTDKVLLFSTFIKMPVVVLIPLLTTLISGQVVSLITSNADVLKFTIYVVMLSGSVLAMHLLNKFVESKIEWRAFGNRFEYIKIPFKHLSKTCLW